MVVLILELILRLKGPEDAADDSFGGKLSRTVTAGILNSPSNCPSYMARAKRGAAELLSNLKPPRTFGQIIRARNQRIADERTQIGRDIREENRRILQNRFSGRENVRRGGRKKKTRRKRKKCIRKATKRLNKCWRKKKRKTFKKCWKKGRKKYKACKKKTKRRR